MSAPQVSIKQFDTARAFDDVLEIDGEPIDLTGCTVELRFYDVAGRNTWIGQGTLTVGTTDGAVSYEFTDEDVENAGDFELEWGVTDSNGKPLTVPTEGRIALTIEPAIQIAP